jgi:site-specific recombinase XerD
MATALVPAGRENLMAKIRSLVLDSVSSPLTRAMYAVALDRFIEWMSARGLRFDKAAVNAYRAELEAQGLSSSSVNQKLSAIRKLAVEAADNGYMDPHLAAGVCRVRGAKRSGVRLGNWLSKQQAQDLISAPDASTLKGTRDRAILALMVGGGFRRNEIAGLTVGHLQMREARWVIVDLRGKHGRVRSVPVPAWAKVAVDLWTQAAGITEGRIFRSVNKGNRVTGESLSPQAIYRIVLRYGAAVGADIAPHDCRRTFSQLAFKGGAPLDQIQLSLGHSSIATTERYLGVRQSLTDAPCDRIGLVVG